MIIKNEKIQFQLHIYRKIQSGPPLEFINILIIKRGSATRIHQPSLPLDLINQNGISLLISSSKGDASLDFINQKGNPSLRIIFLWIVLYQHAVTERI